MSSWNASEVLFTPTIAFQVLAKLLKYFTKFIQRPATLLTLLSQLTSSRQVRAPKCDCSGWIWAANVSQRKSICSSRMFHFLSRSRRNSSLHSFQIILGTRRTAISRSALAEMLTYAIYFRSSGLHFSSLSFYVPLSAAWSKISSRSIIN